MCRISDSYISNHFNQIKKCKDRTESVSCGCMHIFSCTNTFPPTLSRLITNRVAHIAILAVTAAIAEEIGRYIAFRFFVKGQSAQNTPLYFGLGHGGIEALSVGVNSVILLVCSPYTLINMGSDVALAGIERISTLLAQIAFSYIVFCSYQKKTYRYLILAICLHSMYDFPLVLLDYSVSPFIFEIGLFLFSAILLLFTLKGVRGIHSNEKNN